MGTVLVLTRSVLLPTRMAAPPAAMLPAVHSVSRISSASCKLPSSVTLNTTTAQSALYVVNRFSAYNILELYISG